MTEAAASHPEAASRLTLPEHARLLHIGPPKTATTALQSAGAANREELLAHGVRYPGRSINHRGPIAAFLGRRIGWGGPGSDVPPQRAWTELMDEIDGEQSRRVWFGHEFAADADAEKAQQLAEAIGPNIHVVITLRGYASMLPSIWQENLKGGNTGTFDDWLASMLAEPRVRAVAKTHRRHDQGRLVRRWAKAVGAENVTVIVLDKSQPDLLFNAFEELLDLPKGFLSHSAPDGRSANRGMSLPETELIRRINMILRGAGVRWDDYSHLMNFGGVARMLRERTPPAEEPALRLPGWAAEKAGIQAERFVREISGSGVRVVGDLDILTRPVRTREQDASPTHDSLVSVPLDVAVESLTGVISQALGRGSSFEPVIDRDPEVRGKVEDSIARDLTASDLVRILLHRARTRGVRAIRTAPGMGRGTETAESDGKQ